MILMDEKEKFLVNEFDFNLLDKAPSTEKELLGMYVNNSDVLYLYLQENVNPFLLPLSNELRAMLGHIATYRIANPNETKRELDKAYGHLRRFNIDALKILCDEFDRSLSRELQKQYTYDFRDVCANYLKEFSAQYFRAKHLYLTAQVEERVGSDYNVHNLIELYYDAAKEYIELKCYYQEHKAAISRTRRYVIAKRIVCALMTMFGIVVSFAGLFL